jgi:hypothetical protein
MKTFDTSLVALQQNVKSFQQTVRPTNVARRIILLPYFCTLVNCSHGDNNTITFVLPQSESTHIAVAETVTGLKVGTTTYVDTQNENMNQMLRLSQECLQQHNQAVDVAKTQYQSECLIELWFCGPEISVFINLVCMRSGMLDSQRKIATTRNQKLMASVRSILESFDAEDETALTSQANVLSEFSSACADCEFLTSKLI